MKVQQWWMITWIDAETDVGWEKDENVKITRLPAMSVGVIIKEDKGFIILAADVGRCGSGRQTNRRIEIPTRNILHRVRMVQSRKGKK